MEAIIRHLLLRSHRFFANETLFTKQYYSKRKRKKVPLTNYKCDKVIPAERRQIFAFLWPDHGGRNIVRCSQQGFLSE